MVRGLVNHEPVPVALGALTVLSGLIDAVSFLALGRVFTANMTGNLVFLGFAAAGEPGFDVAAAVTALAAFVAGAAGAAWLASSIAAPHPAFLGALAVEAALTAVAAAGAFAGARYLAAAALALAMGVRNGTVNRLAVPDMTTTVVTRTLAALVGDLADRSAGRGATTRRLVSVAGLVAGAVAGAFLVRHLGAGWVLVVICGAQVLVAAGHHAHVVLRRRAG